MSVDEIMAELQAMDSESIKKILLRHGVKEPFFGVKVAQLKTIPEEDQKKLSARKGFICHWQRRCDVPGRINC